MIRKFCYEIFKHCITKCELAYWNVELPIQEDKLKFTVTHVNYPFFNFETTVNILCNEKIHIQIYKDEILISNIALKSEYYKPYKSYLMHMLDRIIGNDS